MIVPKTTTSTIFAGETWSATSAAIRDGFNAFGTGFIEGANKVIESADNIFNPNSNGVTNWFKDPKVQRVLIITGIALAVVGVIALVACGVFFGIKAYRECQNSDSSGESNAASRSNSIEEENPSDNEKNLVEMEVREIEVPQKGMAFENLR